MNNPTLDYKTRSWFKFFANCATECDEGNNNPISIHHQTGPTER